MILFLRCLVLLAIIPCIGCSKDPDVIIKTVNQIDTLYINHTDTVKLTEYINDSTTTFILSRHAETSGAGSDPILSAAGLARAEELVKVLHTTPVKGIFTTNYTRTTLTATPLSVKLGLNLQIYDPTKLSQLVDQILQQYRHQVVYIVGHSNTTNVILNTLVGSNVYPDIPESEYDNLYVVSVSKKGNARVVHLKYGN